MAKLDPDVIAALKKQVPKVAKKDIRVEIEKRFKKVKEQMVAEFLGHPITKEILAGPDAPNTSGTLNGISNLFAFIGFDRGAQPILPIMELLNRTQIIFKKDLKGRFIGSEFEITLPTREQIFAVTPLPYVGGRSWAGSAIQTRVKVRKGRFQNVPYVSSFLNKYIKKFKELK